MEEKEESRKNSPRKSKYEHTEISELFSEKMKNHPSNYSPVTCRNYNTWFRVLCKVLDTIDPDHLMWHIELGAPTVQTIYDSEISESTKDQVIRAIPCIYKILAEEEMTDSMKEPYVKKMLSNNGKYMRSITLKKAQERLPLYTDFAEGVLGMYGEDSQEYLLVSLYKELTCRDDFSQLLITPTYKKSISKYNYIVVQLYKPCEVILNNYKTSKKYGPLRVVFSTDLSKRIKKYINGHNLQYGQYLFPQSSLSAFVGRILQKSGLTGGISTLRRMVVSEFYNSGEKSDEEYEELAKRMGHSSAVATNIYHRANV